MGSISMVEAELPPGFRFHPRDEELICDYLMKKVTCCESTLMIEVDLNKSEPWEIPETACVGGKEWYFYSLRDRKYSIGLRTNRATASGYWKATGKDRPVLRKGTLVGMRKTLVFYQGRAPKGRKTDWVMHEFRLEGPLLPHPKVSSLKEDWVLCRVLYKKREVVIPGKGSSMGSYYYDDMTDTSSLPPLMDSYITFDHQITQTTTTQDDDNNYNKNVISNNNNQFEQVPCFSIFSQNQTNINTNHPTFISSSSSSTHIMEPNLLPNNMPTFGGLSSDLVTYLNPPLSCDKDVLKAFLNHLTKLETSSTTPTSMKASPSLCETSPESYLYI